MFDTDDKYKRQPFDEQFPDIRFVKSSLNSLNKKITSLFIPAEAYSLNNVCNISVISKKIQNEIELLVLTLIEANLSLKLTDLKVLKKGNEIIQDICNVKTNGNPNFSENDKKVLKQSIKTLLIDCFKPGKNTSKEIKNIKLEFELKRAYNMGETWSDDFVKSGLKKILSEIPGISPDEKFWIFSNKKALNNLIELLIPKLEEFCEISFEADENKKKNEGIITDLLNLLNKMTVEFSEECKIDNYNKKTSQNLNDIQQVMDDFFVKIYTQMKEITYRLKDKKNINSNLEIDLINTFVYETKIKIIVKTAEMNNILEKELKDKKHTIDEKEFSDSINKIINNGSDK